MADSMGKDGKEEQLQLKLNKQRIMESSLPSRSLALAASLLLLLPLVHGLLVPEDPVALTYHGGPLVRGNLDLSLVFYGPFGRVQKNAIRSFLKSLSYTGAVSAAPSVSTWWRMVESYQPGGGSINVRVVKQYVDPAYTYGKVVTVDFIKILMQKALVGVPKSVVVVFTAKDVAAQGLCLGKCAEHGVIDGKPYVVVGNPEMLCPGDCAWPFRVSEYLPRGPILRPPSGDIGADAMVMALASGLASMVTNPFNTGYYQLGRKSAVFEAGTVCPGKFASGAVLGNPGRVRIDPISKGAFNAQGFRGKKFLLPGVWNPKTKSCWSII